jgi:hypothetical protein
MTSMMATGQRPHEREDAPEDILERNLRDAGDHEAEQAHRGLEEAGEQHHDGEDPEPDPGVLETDDHGVHDRGHDHQDGDLVHQGTEEEVDHKDQGDDHPRSDVELLDPDTEFDRDTGYGEEEPEDLSSNHEHEDEGRGADGPAQRPDEARPGHASGDDPIGNGKECPGGTGLGGGEDPEVDPAHADPEDHRHRPHQPDRPPFAQVGSFSRPRCIVGPNAHDEVGGEHEDGGGDDPRDDPADEHLADGLLGEHSVEDEDRRWGDQDAQGATDCGGAGSKPLVVVESPHLGYGHHRHRGGRGHRRPRHRTEQRRCPDGGNSQSAPHPPQERVDGLVDIFAQCRGGQSKPHEDE